MLKEGQTFPSFELEDQNGVIRRSADLAGKSFVIYFYPKDDTPGCTQEACEFRDGLGQFPGTKVFGVSPDTAKSHAKFAKKYELNFPLLSDPEKALIEACGLWVEKSMYGKTYMGTDRSTWLIDPQGVVQAAWRKVRIKGHVEAVLDTLRAKTA
jgi:thioredoxin-dependent peroxiredoxin